ncbi:hypothetical protein QUG67_21390, partial [Enterobacter hormaechei]|uniref:hypothetical protein n=1 Tax=Enterobacter hormaechei TaxID=158836 RepID=UPI0025A2FBDD
MASVVQGYGIACFVPQSGAKLKRVPIRVSAFFVKIKHNKYKWLFIVFYSYYRTISTSPAISFRIRLV